MTPLNGKPMNSLLKTVDITKVLNLVSKLKQVDTKNVVPTSQVTGLINVLREDVIDSTRTLTQEEALSNAKKQLNGFFVC